MSTMNTRYTPARTTSKRTSVPPSGSGAVQGRDFSYLSERAYQADRIAEWMTRVLLAVLAFVIGAALFGA